MKPSRLFTIIFITLFASGIVHSVLARKSLPKAPQDSQNALYAVIPDASSFRQIADHPIYAALDQYEKLIGYAFYTQHLVSGISGYGGPIHLLIGIAPDGMVQNIMITHHQETPGFTDRMTTLLKQFEGKNIQTSFAIGKEINGITGATVTASAIVSTVNIAGQQIATLLSLAQHQTDMQDSSPLHIFIPILIVLILFSLSVMACITRKTMTRWIALGSGFLFLGLLTQNMLSTAHIAGIALFQIPSWNANPLWHVLMLGAIVSALMIGRIYCSGVCPFGFVEEFLYTINTKFFHLRMSPGKNMDAFCRWIKYIVLITLLSLCLITQHSGIGAAEVYITLFTQRQAFWSWGLVVIILVSSFFFLRFWCRYLCPFGAFLAMITQLPFARRKLSTHICADASECFSCDHCSYKDVYRNTVTQSRFFIILLTASLVIFGLSVTETIKGTLSDRITSEKNIAIPTHQEYSDSSAVKKNLSDAGITPHPAKYWRVLNND